MAGNDAGCVVVTGVGVGAGGAVFAHRRYVDSATGTGAAGIFGVP
jgi:hypothetical protein